MKVSVQISEDEWADMDLHHQRLLPPLHVRRRTIVGIVEVDAAAVGTAVFGGVYDVARRAGTGEWVAARRNLRALVREFGWNCCVAGPRADRALIRELRQILVEEVGRRRRRG